MVIADMGSVRPGVPTLTVGLRGMAAVIVEARTLAGPKHSGQFGGAAPDALLALLHALADAARREGRRRRRRACGARSGRAPPTARRSSASWPRSSRACRSSAPAASASGSGRGRRSPSPASTRCRSTRRVNAVVPYARAKLSLRIHPEQDPSEAQAALIRHLEQLRPFGIPLEVEAAETGKGFAARTSGPAYEAARAALATAWGSETVQVATGGSIPLVSALQRGRARRRDPAARHHRRLRQHPRAERARAASTSSRRRCVAEAEFFREYAAGRGAGS